jgi:hypothetical protein
MAHSLFRADPTPKDQGKEINRVSVGDNERHCEHDRLSTPCLRVTFCGLVVDGNVDVAEQRIHQKDRLRRLSPGRSTIVTATFESSSPRVSSRAFV